VKPLVSFAEALRLDRVTMDRYGLTDDQLMEAAAIGMVRALEAEDGFRLAMDAAAVPAAAVCGGGNNGGDALAVLRRLALEGRAGLVAVVPAKTGETTARRLAEARKAGVVILEPGDQRARTAIAEAGLVLDGCSGVGYKGPRRPELAALLELVAHAQGPLIAVDVPSGMGPFQNSAADPGLPVRATVTLCVEPLKAELYCQGNRPYAGRIVPIGGVFPRLAGSGSNLALLDEGDLATLLPRIDADCHKGERGALGVFAGAVGSTGAAVLCARAGSAAGAGSVTLIVREAMVPVLAGLVVSQMVRPASDPGSRRYTAVVAGPGWGADAANARTMDELWDAALPLVLDADALRLLAAARKAPRCSPLVITPHPGEFAPLAALAAGAEPDDPAALETARQRTRYDTAAVVADTARHFGAIVVLKGSVTWMADPDGRLAVWDGREPTLATAGSGDVLAGLAGGFLARGATAWDAAACAVITHGLAGRAASRNGFYEAEALPGEAARIAYQRNTDGNQG